MTVVVTDNCNACRFTECVSVCPVACFHGDASMLYVDQDTCVDCGACVPVCPVQAIFFEHDVPADKMHWLEVNRTRSAELPVIDEKMAPLPGAEHQRASLGFAS